MSNYLYTNIVEELENSIRSGEISIGMKLPSERAMAEKYGVSRNVVREAYKIMSEKGIVDIQIGKGAFVCAPKVNVITDRLQEAISATKSNLYDILEVREILETAIARKAVVMANNVNIDILEDLYEKMNNSLRDPIKYAEYDIKFHIEIANCIGNAMLVLLINTFNQISDKKLYNLNNIYPDRVSKAQREHRAMIDAIKDRDENKILAAVNAHINCIENELRILEV